MASTPPPMPSSDEGEFDDDDFGCFTSSAPIKAGVDSESDDDAHQIQGHSHDASVKSLPHMAANFELGSDAPDIVCNGNQAHGPELSSNSNSEPGANSEMRKENMSATSSINVGEGDFTNSDKNSCCCSAIPDISSDFHDSPSHDKYTPESYENEEENCVEMQGSGSSQLEEVDDWADFSPAPSLNSFQGDQVKDVTVECRVTESFQHSDQNSVSLGSTCVSAEVHDEFDLQNGVSHTEPENSETTNKTNEAIDDACNIENDDENSVYQSGEDKAECRSGNNDFAGNQSSPELNVDVSSCCENVTMNHTDVSDSAQESSSNMEITNDDDDDDFGDFSDFSCHKGKENSSEEDVAPISFRTSTCEEDLEEEDEDHNDFHNENAFVTNSGETGESPLPYGVDNEEGDDDWGFKGADNNVGDSSANNDDDFGDFGGCGNVAASDDANWADFSDSTTPATVKSDDMDELDVDEFQSQASSLAVQTSSFQDGQSKLEKAISASFPHDQQILFHEYASKNKKDDKSESKSEREEEREGMNALDSVLEMGLKGLPSAKQETWTITKEIRIKDPMVRIWEHMKDVNACHALDFGWNSSECSQNVYSTLHIDTQNVLFSQKKQAVPFFASGLGILEPIRGGANPPEKQNGPPPLVDTRTQEESQKEPPQDIPPVDFDWSSSGLTDPLKVFKSDGFNAGLSSFEPFAEILQKSAAAKHGSSDKELSPEARSILKKIPNLSFMQSKVLMFPIKDA